MTMAVAAADDLLKFLVYVSYDGMVASSAFSRTTLFMRIESIGLPIVWVRSDWLGMVADLFATASCEFSSRSAARRTTLVCLHTAGCDSEVRTCFVSCLS